VDDIRHALSGMLQPWQLLTNHQGSRVRGMEAAHRRRLCYVSSKHPPLPSTHLHGEVLVVVVL
jgi:hypothetical protein